MSGVFSFVFLKYIIFTFICTSIYVFFTAFTNLRNGKYVPGVFYPPKITNIDGSFMLLELVSYYIKATTYDIMYLRVLKGR